MLHPNCALPVARTMLSLFIIATSEPTLMYEPHHSTCLQNSDLPSLTNRIASGVGMTQFSLNCLLFNNFFAPYIVNASPPSVRKVATNLLLRLKFLILPVFLENSYWRSSPSSAVPHSVPEDSVNMTIYLICPVQ